MALRVYIGHDAREQAAFDVACKTARSFGCEVIPLYEERLRLSGMLTRPLDRREGMYDLNSNANQATEFALSRFFVPLLAHDGWALFVDCDTVFLHDPTMMLAVADPFKAVHVVKHPPLELSGTKMDGQPQSSYRRKLWSSVALWNCKHEANARLNLTMLNQWPGRRLHAFEWLHDDEIGELPPEWNHLVGVYPHSDSAKILHFTLGCPNMAGYENSEYADVWWQAAGR